MSGESAALAVSKRSELQALTGLRIVAAAWVFLHHFDDVILGLMPGLSFLEPLIHQGWRGVDLFFALSGFILAYQYMDRFSGGVRRKEYLQFMRLRIARIYPVHILTLHTSVILFTGAAILGVPVQEGLSDNTPWTYIQNLLLIQSWWGHPLSWNGVSWSVSAEFFAYLLFPVAAFLIFKVRSALAAWILGALGLALFTAAYHTVNTGAAVTTDGDLYRIAASFLAGCFLYKVYSLRPAPTRLWAFVPGICVAAVIGISYIPNPPHILVLPFLALLVLGLAYNIDPLAALLSKEGMVYGGAISYSFYMVHQQILTVARSVIPESLYGGSSWPLGLAIVLATFGFVWLAAHLVYRLVEEPSRILIRGKKTPKGRHSGAAQPEKISAPRAGH